MILGLMLWVLVICDFFYFCLEFGLVFYLFCKFDQFFYFEICFDGFGYQWYDVSFVDINLVVQDFFGVEYFLFCFGKVLGDVNVRNGIEVFQYFFLIGCSVEFVGGDVQGVQDFFDGEFFDLFVDYCFVVFVD